VRVVRGVQDWMAASVLVLVLPVCVQLETVVRIHNYIKSRISYLAEVRSRPVLVLVTATAGNLEKRE